MKHESVEHIPVMPSEVLSLLRPEDGGLFVDATLGGASHADLILSSSDNVELIGLDMDPVAIAKATEKLARFGERARVVQANFRDIYNVVRSITSGPVKGILADLGVSSMQLTGMPEKGFSFMQPGPINMRMDAADHDTALDLIAELDEKELATVIRDYGEEKFASKIARAIKEAYAEDRLTNTTALAGIVSSSIPARFRPYNIHPATRTFQALRIAVNDELGNLQEFLPQALELLSVSGRLAIISFHSLEDRIVSRQFKAWESPCICPPALPVCGCGKKRLADIITRKVCCASKDETDRNPRSRSSRLRVCQKVAI